MKEKASEEAMTLREAVEEILVYVSRCRSDIDPQLTFEQGSKKITEVFLSRLPEKMKGCDNGDGRFGCCAICFGAKYHNDALAAVWKRLGGNQND